MTTRLEMVMKLAALALVTVVYLVGCGGTPEESTRLQEENQGLRLQNERLRTQNENLQEDKGTLQEDKESLEEDLEEKDHEIEELRAENERLRVQNASLQDALEDGLQQPRTPPAPVSSGVPWIVVAALSGLLAAGFAWAWYQQRQRVRFLSASSVLVDVPLDPDAKTVTHVNPTDTRLQKADARAPK